MNLKNLEKYLQVNLLGAGPRLIKKNLLDRGLTEFEKNCSIYPINFRPIKWKTNI